MSKQYGLIVPNKDKDKAVVQRPSIFDDSDSDQESVPTGLKRPLKKQDKITQHKAIEEDPTVYQYDEIYDEMDKKRKESKLSRKDLDRKPKYISRLMAAADRRKKDNERRIERQVQKERETEGDEFKDKDAFVTSAYKKKLEEMKEMEELEKREDYLEAIGDVTKQGNLDGFYRHLYDQKVNYEEDTKKHESTSKVTERKYRKREDSNDSENDVNDAEEEVKKEHLPSNLDADSDFSIDSSDSDADETKEDVKTSEETPASNTPPPPETTEMKQETEAEAAPPEPPKPKLDIWKKRTVGAVYDAALLRYYERKALREL